MSQLEYKDLPKLTPKQQKAVEHYLLNGNKSAAYRDAYKSDKLTPRMIATAATRVFQNANVSLVIEYHQAKAAEKFDVTFDDQIKILAVVQRGGIKVKIDAQGNKVMADPKATVSASTEISRMKGFHAPINTNVGVIDGEITNENTDAEILDKLLKATATRPKRKISKKPKS